MKRPGIVTEHADPPLYEFWTVVNWPDRMDHEETCTVDPYTGEVECAPFPNTWETKIVGNALAFIRDAGADATP